MMAHSYPESLLAKVEKLVFKGILFLCIKSSCDTHRLTSTGYLLHRFNLLKNSFSFKHLLRVNSGFQGSQVSRVSMPKVNPLNSTWATCTTYMPGLSLNFSESYAISG